MKILKKNMEIKKIKKNEKKVGCIFSFVTDFVSFVYYQTNFTE